MTNEILEVQTLIIGCRQERRGQARLTTPHHGSPSAGTVFRIGKIRISGLSHCTGPGEESVLQGASPRIDGGPSMGDTPDIYAEVARRWTDDLWGWLDHVPGNGVMQSIMRENFDEREMRALAAIPLRTVPLDMVPLQEIAANSVLPPEELESVLDSIAERGLLHSSVSEAGEKAYALVTMAFGFSQVFYWKGEKSEHAKKMALLENDPDFIRAKADMFTELETKPFRYIPVTESIESVWQNVYPKDTIETVIQKARRIALVQCPCRTKYEMLHGESCGHSTDVCMKMNELADSVIRSGLGREITQEEALEAIRKANAEGLVHFADNTEEGMMHICNCCGCACWNVGPIRRRQVPRDMLMATYFLRETDPETCSGCEECVRICPVDAVTMVDGVAQVDLDWCIGCGVCQPRCPADAIHLVEKATPPRQTENFRQLHTKVAEERTAALARRSAAPGTGTGR